MAAKTAAQRMADRLEAEALADPLRDLRDPDAPEDQPGLQGAEDGSQGPLEVAPTFTPGALVTLAQQDLAKAALIATWHADSTSLGFIHKGGTCGCWYLAGVTVRAILPVQANDDAEPEPDATGE